MLAPVKTMHGYVHYIFLELNFLRKLTLFVFDHISCILKCRASIVVNSGVVCTYNYGIINFFFIGCTPVTVVAHCCTFAVCRYD